MKTGRTSLRYLISMVIVSFTLIVAGGIYYILRNLSMPVIFQQITSLIIVLLIWSLSIYLIYRLFMARIIAPLYTINNVLKHASVGDLTVRANCSSNDELGEISDSVDRIIQNQLNLSDLLEKIGDGNFNIDYEVLGEKDKLGFSAISMKDKLLKLSEEDSIRQWTSEGITLFGAILRENTDDIRNLGDKLISEMVRYLDANQGALFLLNDEDRENPVLDLVSAYAWKRKKFLEKTIGIGEGLIGQAAIEKDTIFLTDVPENFIRITSGLGDANPRSILIVPLIFNEELFGIIEFASFKVLRKFEISFVENIAQIIASTISRININRQTQMLLRDSQKLTEELRTQEEEMRQNLEEMNGTQEEMQQREVERIGIFTAINNTLATVEFNMDGIIIDANEKFLSMMNYTLEEIEGKSDRIFADRANEPIELYNKFWSELRQGTMQRGDFKRLTKDGRDIWLNASYTPSLDKSGKPYKVIKLAQDITEKKKAELELVRQAEEMRLQGEKLKKYTAELEDIKQNLSEKLSEAGKGLMKKIQDIEYQKAKNIAVLEGCVDGVISFNQEGYIEYFNHSAEEIWNLQRESVLGKPINTIIPVRIARNESNLTAFWSSNGSSREIEVRTEISFPDINGNTIDLLATLTKAKVGDEITFTIFAQKISVDLF